MFGENARHYLWDDEEEENQEILPSPQLEAVERREQRVATALEEGRPADGHSIAAYSVNQCLYVADIGNNCILRLKINNGEITVKWMN